MTQVGALLPRDGEALAPGDRAGAMESTGGRGAGLTVWLTGLPAAGKTSLAQRLAEEARDPALIEMLDGDELRGWLSTELGFDATSRSQHVRRVGRLCVMLARHSVVPLVSVVSPYEKDRDHVRALHVDAGLEFVEVHVATPLDVCRARDPKGLYAAASAGLVSNLTGTGDIYEAPSHAEVVIDASGDLDTTTATLVRKLRDRVGIAAVLWSPPDGERSPTHADDAGAAVRPHIVPKG